MQVIKYKKLFFGFILALSSFGLATCGGGDSDSDSDQEKPSVIGSWYYSDAPDFFIVLTFLDDEKYVIVNDEDDEDSAGEDGFEFGTYNLTSKGVFTATAVVDDNGEWGFSHPCENETLTLEVVGNTLTLMTDGGVGSGCSGEGANDVIELTRVESNSDPLIGTWLLEHDMSQNYFALVSLMSDGRYLMMENDEEGEGGMPGIESGSYEMNEISELYEFVATGEGSVDTNGDWGLNGGSIGLEIDDNTLILDDGDVEFSLERVR